MAPSLLDGHDTNSFNRSRASFAE
ncbi:unnamed protein product [Spirodela intermedia]|uniref:Uncharacterized protein n=1 Tax=Spirodela intermedia TaxID=51605 RepID=A0ABN7ED67_SPIIN|nr:unnamed protein product [Spirodela intermedia]